MQPTPNRPAPPPAADWALFSKVPGRTMDYDILAGSLPAEEAVWLVRAGLTGQPDGPAEGQPEELPWFTFVGGPPEQPASFTVSAMSWSDARDGTGQVIAPSRLLRLPWPVVAPATLGCRGAVALLDGLGWHQLTAGPPGTHDGQPTPLPDLPAGRPEAMAGLVEELGFDWVAGTAAALLDGAQVVVTSAGRLPSPYQRLAVADAICALLPYAQRARLSIATWANHRVPHTIRLSFAARAAANQTEASLEPRTPAVPGTAEGRAYLETLHRLRDKGFTVAQMVGHLAQQRDPALCPDAVAARLALLNVDLPAAVHEEIRAGTGVLDRVRWVLDHLGGWSALPDPAMRRTYGLFLGEQAAGGPRRDDAATTLALFWSPELVGHLADRAAPDLAAGSLTRIQAWLAVEATRPAPQRTLLTEVTHRVTGRESVRARQALIDLLVVADAADPAHRLLLDDPTRGGPLVLAAAATETGPPRINLLADQWQPLLPAAHWLRPLLLAAGRAVPVSAADLAELRSWPAGPDELVALARGSRAWPALFGPLWPVLADWAARRTSGSGEPRALLAEAAGTRLDETALARYDLVNLLATGTLPYATGQAVPLPAAYQASFRAGWTGPELAPARRLLGISLIRALTGEAAGVAHLRLLTHLVDLAEPDLRRETAPHLRAHLRQHSVDWRRLDLTDEWALLVGGWVPAIRALAELSRRGADAGTLTELRGRGADTETVAIACLDALAAGATQEDVLEALGPWLHRRHPDQLADLQLLLLFRMREPANWQFAERLLWHLTARGGVDPTALVTTLRERNRLVSWLATRATELHPPAGPHPPEPGDGRSGLVSRINSMFRGQPNGQDS
ncbi:hypothetical protein O7606_15970 [Micromonospora sp. WMMD882]|uniref:hypothetical protein n=1 Tax=Micromonospora sp. WMMD882 TaxID=3015151 RepID=UPI00248AC74D|nr:hypothetical protein [Micromonospora sp. WMMD882]WBB77767.1 hypothetical protein O7606_15970 [Micromonospora sp. WMMD882]